MPFWLSTDGTVTAYDNIFTYSYFRDFGLGAVIREGLISRFFDVFIAKIDMNWSGNFRKGLTREIRENKTLVKITAYTVLYININKYCVLIKYSRMNLSKGFSKLRFYILYFFTITFWECT